MQQTVQQSQAAEADHEVFTTRKVLEAVQANQTLMCERASPTQSVTEVVPLCEPKEGPQLGTLLKDTTQPRRST